ncbi:uncharacterized protein LOC106662018 [Cimex lectularius]|uniref:Protein sleepless n=1 Tax=Cimex lectularius TaxID=79782 RepID=A0A8I6RC99_CIMLE|nr:uncharacterized protein LOC106662018 [Cimex lectularius]
MSWKSKSCSMLIERSITFPRDIHNMEFLTRNSRNDLCSGPPPGLLSSLLFLLPVNHGFTFIFSPLTMKVPISSISLNVCFLLITLQSLVNIVEGGFNRCFKCRSRGDLGSCKDNFVYNNASALDEVRGIEAVPCTSGWCGKILDKGSNSFKDEEYGAATERLCLQRGPEDSEERCALTTWRNEKVFMCFCQGDLCNSSTKSAMTTILLLVSLLPVLINN